jgi:CPA2 family monovalent cation:H+ antiporter-2
MAAEVDPTQYKDAVLFLATAGIVIPLFRRWKISPILGFLAAGVALGPFGLGALHEQAPWLAAFTIANPAEIAQLAEFGVVFLLFMIGLELSWERLRLLRRLVFGLGAAQVSVCTAVIAAGAYMLGQPVLSAVSIGAALALSSTAIVMPILADQKRQHTPQGRAVFSVLLFQDLAVAPILVTIAVLGSQAAGGAVEDFNLPRILMAFAPAVAGILAIIFAGRLLLRPMLRSVARAKSDELFMAASLLIVIGAGLAAALTGLSMALGAFIAGLLLAETEYRRQVEVTIQPFKGLLLGLFFLSVGSSLDLAALARDPLQLVGLALGILLLKGVVVFTLCRLFRLAWTKAMEAVLLLAAGGEFAFVILGSAMTQGLVDPGAAQAVLVATTLSMFCLPVFAEIGKRIGTRQSQSATAPLSPPPPQDSGIEPAVLVVGFGRVGRLVGDMLTRHEIAWCAVDRDPKLVEAGRRAGHKIHFGEASRAEFLQRCGLDAAKALVVTMDSPEGAESVVAQARSLRPDLIIVARARDDRHAKTLYELGATDAVPETIEASLQLSEAVLVDIGVPMGLVIASIHERRDEFRKLLNRPDALGGRRGPMRISS